MDKNKKQQKVVLIIGGTGGIGLEIADSLVKNDYKVCLTYKVNKGGGRGAGLGNCLEYQVDLESDNSVKNAIESVYKDNGRIDAVVYAASAEINPGPFKRKKWDDFQKHLDVQVRGFFQVVQSVLNLKEVDQKMKFVILLTEACIGTPPVYMSDYVTAKYGLMGLAKCLSIETANNNCTVNMVSPGMTNTKLISKMPSKLIEMMALKNPLKRIAEPKDVANAVKFLVSEESDYINGANITVNGGGIMF